MIACTSPILKISKESFKQRGKGSLRDKEEKTLQEDDLKISKQKKDLNEILMNEISQGKFTIGNKQTIQVKNMY